MNLKFLKEEDIKQQLMVDDDIFTESQSSIIERMAQSAEQAALNFMCRTLESLIEEYGEVPAPIHMACLSEIASNYDVRENEAERSARTLRITNYKRWQGALLPYRKIV